jgi:hypothetical protein
MGNEKSETPSQLTAHHGSHILPSFPALTALLIFVLANIAVQPLADVDFGWHLRTGLDLLQHGGRMPATDPYSHTMPDWQWVELAWLLDGVLAALVHGLGEAGLLSVVLLFAGFIAGSFVLAGACAPTSWTIRLTAIATGLLVIRPFLGARTQMVTLLGFALVFWCWQQYQQRRWAHLWVLPPIFLCWANLHGGFASGLALLALILAVAVAVRLSVDRWPWLAERIHEPLLSWRQIRHVALVGGVAVGLTFVNPYGWRIYQEIYGVLSDRLEMQTLAEWRPLVWSDPTAVRYAIYLGVLGVMLGCWYRKVEPTRWVVLLVYGWWSLAHWRNMQFVLLLATPLWAEMLDHAVKRAARLAPTLAVYPKQWGLAAAVALAFWIAWLGPGHLQLAVKSAVSPDEFFRRTWYPIEAVEWIRANRVRLGTRLYNDYAYGGFLHWWLPEEKVFIDGRMSAWRIGERWIYADYLALHAKTPDLNVLDKYKVDWTLVQRDSPLDRAIGAQNRWQAVYQDRKVTIYIRRSS